MKVQQLRSMNSPHKCTIRIWTSRCPYLNFFIIKRGPYNSSIITSYYNGPRVRKRVCHLKVATAHDRGRTILPWTPWHCLEVQCVI